jgi:hypothetical protein
MVDFVQLGQINFYFNVTAPVGVGQMNRVDDVELVRFGYKSMVKAAKVPVDPQLKSLIDKMPYKGPFSDDVAAVIKQHEKVRGGTQDGRISRAVTFHGTGYDGQHSWIIEVLSNNIRAATGKVFPRLDLDTDCGPNLKAGLVFIFDGVNQ